VDIWESHKSLVYFSPASFFLPNKFESTPWVDEFIGESITKINNSMNIELNLKLFLCMTTGTRRLCFYIRQVGDNKSRDAVPLEINHYLNPTIRIVYALLSHKNYVYVYAENILC
jgi:hypothetical protein